VSTSALLGPADPPSFRVARAAGASPFVLSCDHAGRLLPEKLKNLGLPERELATHIAWDLGIAGLGEQLARELDAFLILQTYSRLVIDVNRPLSAPDSIVTRSERTDIPGNIGLSAEEAEARAQAVFWPYHQRIARELDRRRELALPTILVTLHSFTPVYMDQARAVEVGVLYGRDARLGHALLKLLHAAGEHHVGDNEPYAVSDDGDYTLLVHGEARGLLNVELEVRQDLLATEAEQHALAVKLAALLRQATSALFPI
jgi:predicted N-formylglutamate amidohydrolase